MGSPICKEDNFSMHAETGIGERKLRIAGAQLPITDDIAANARAILGAIEYAAGEKADLLLTPEGSLSGYNHTFDQAEVDRASGGVLTAARRSGLGMALGTCWREADGRRFNQIRLYDREGRFLGSHAKILLCGMPADLASGEHRHFETKPLEVFQMEGFPVGCLICNDLWANPEWTPGDDTHLTRRLAHMGAKIILHAVNSGGDSEEFAKVVKAYHESNLCLRARADRLWIVTVNDCYPLDEPCSCSSGIISPDGKWAIRAPDTGAQYFTYSIGLD